ncbi:hypothetical protein [Wenjunlia tyrosinilytica]|uniref:Uncharacterized protein n=1 Tax=Wenjunlia tyrosinilytica TaxID=1544741 RepID=A0A917ZYK0_9ACTN|nr:hypothetical protein [Wenjunlia tyrosinilytica]GGP00007.1 hypothetical protein GCM10012280_67750 [Wenjunlia tyrosinilytica]
MADETKPTEEETPEVEAHAAEVQPEAEEGVAGATYHYNYSVWPE